MRAEYFGETPVAIDKERYYLSTRINSDEHEYYTLADSINALQEVIESEINLYNVQKAQEAVICIVKLMSKWFHEKDVRIGSIDNNREDDYVNEADHIISILQSLLDEHKCTMYEELIQYVILTIDTDMKAGSIMNTDFTTKEKYNIAIMHYYRGSRNLFYHINMDNIANMYNRIFEDTTKIK